jgi:hypothetical protein
MQDLPLQRIEILTQVDLKNKSIWELLGSTASELGEVSDELLIEEKSFGNANKTGGGEGSQIEAVDLTICALSLYFARGGTVEKLSAIMNSKLDKWEKKQNDSRSKSPQRLRSRTSLSKKPAAKLQPKSKRVVRP